MSTENNGGGLLQGEALTAEERSYMDSAGTAELEAPAPAPAPVATPADTGDNGHDTDADNDGSDDEIDVEFDDEGVARDKNTGKFVPKSVALRYKEQAKSTKEALSRVAIELIRRRERDAVLSEITSRQDQQQAAPEADREIDPTEDIFGAYAQMAKKVQELSERVGKTDETVRGQFEQISMQQLATRDMQAFSAQEPAFLDAYKYLEGQRHAELEALGIADPGQRQEIVRREARELVQSALKSNASGAERIFKLAKARGFQAAPVKDPPDLDPNAVDKINRINNGKAASASLRNAGGTSDVGQNLTPQKLADMGDREFAETRAAYIKKNGAHAWDRLIGGG